MFLYAEASSHQTMIKIHNSPPHDDDDENDTNVELGKPSPAITDVHLKTRKRCSKFWNTCQRFISPFQPTSHFPFLRLHLVVLTWHSFETQCYLSISTPTVEEKPTKSAIVCAWSTPMTKAAILSHPFFQRLQCRWQQWRSRGAFQNTLLNCFTFSPKISLSGDIFRILRRKERRNL